MPIEPIPLPEYVTRKQLAEIIGESPNNLSMLTHNGTIPPPFSRGKYDLVECVSAYCKHLKKARTTAGRKEINGVSYDEQRALRLQDQRFDDALERAERMRKVLILEDQQQVFDKLGAWFHNEFMNLAKQAIDDLPGDPDENRRVLVPRFRGLLERVCDRIEALGSGPVRKNGRGRKAKSGPNGRSVGRRLS